MKINEKTMYAFACSRPVDREGFLSKRGEVNKAFQKRWFVLKGNLLFYYEKRISSEPLGMIILEGCTVELCEAEDVRFSFCIIFPGNRRYVLAADNFELMEAWMKSLTTAGYDYMRLMISELQRQLSELDSNSSSSSTPGKSDELQIQLPIPPRRLNPFNRTYDVPIRNRSKSPIAPPKSPTPKKNQPLRIAPPPPISPIIRDTANIPINDDNELQDDFNFLTVHEYFSDSWIKVAKIRQEAKEKTEKPLIVF